MEKEQEIKQTRFESSGFSETRLDKTIDQYKNPNTQGSILFSKKPYKRKNPFNWLRIRSFFIKHKQFKRMMEFSCHPTGVHLLRLAVFYSESGCGMCKIYVEKNLF